MAKDLALVIDTAACDQLVPVEVGGSIHWSAASRLRSKAVEFRVKQHAAILRAVGRLP